MSFEDRIPFKEVVEFIKTHKEEFDKFEEDLSIVTKWAKEISKSKKEQAQKDRYSSLSSKIEFDDSYSFSSSEDRGIIFFKDIKHSKTLNEIFVDFVKNHFNTVSNNEEFELSTSPDLDKFRNVSLLTKEEKIIYISSLFRIIFDHKFVSTVDIKSLEKFMNNNNIIIIDFDKYDLKYLEDSTVEVSNNGEATSTNYYNSIKEIKRDGYIHIAHLMSNLSKERTVRDKGGRESYHRRQGYDALAKSEYLESALPQNTVVALRRVLCKDTDLGIPYNVSNDFAMNVIYNALPSKLTMDFYKKFKRNILESKENDKMATTNIMFNIMFLLLKKYGFKTLDNAKYIEKDDWAKIYSINYFSNKKYKDLVKLDKEFIVKFINTNLTDNYGVRNGVLNMGYSCSILANLEKNDLEYVIEATKGSFVEMLKMVIMSQRGDQIEKLSGLYNPKDIKSKKLFRDLKFELNKYYYRDKSVEFVAFTDTMKKQIEKDFFKYVLVKKTTAAGTPNHNADQECEQYEPGRKILEEIAKTFSIRVN